MTGYIHAAFPETVHTHLRITSRRTAEYNCIAWAAEDDERWWWPFAGTFAYWPPGVPLEESVAAFEQAYGTLGYVACGMSSQPDEGWQKIALYEKTGVITHAARQLPNGLWTSKLGEAEDVEHELKGLEGAEYGRVCLILKRKQG
ncbi:hypothetical protein HUW62_05390 [Myxococcus sp. AM011]|uniref:DUF7689 domain-containing protein n=1 Tax=Myxococcus sp. AM011 TaxID=2745200 RepID=UPI001595A127|nr:hypothetical protein [Myxococcus sp. AM011]NVJ20655.1 hypothetical protein [Myxococcus sp. AM011]